MLGREEDETVIRNAIRGCNDDELAVLAEVARGLMAGRETYGPLDLATDGRDFAVEALEEYRDAAVYLSAALVRRRRVAAAECDVKWHEHCGALYCECEAHGVRWESSVGSPIDLCPVGDAHYSVESRRHP